MLTPLTPRAPMRVGGAIHFDKPAAGGDDPVATITKSIEDIKGQVAGFEQKADEKFVKREEIATLQKSLDDLTGEVKVIGERSDDAPFYGLPFTSGCDFLQTYMKAQMGDKQAREIIYDGEKSYVKVAEHVMTTKYKAPSGFHSQDTEGMFILPEVAADLLRTAPTLLAIRERARIIRMSGNSYEIRALVDKNHSTSVSGGIIVSRTPEGGPASPSKAEFEKIMLRPSKLTGLVYITEEMLEDTTAFASLIPQLVRDQFTSVEESDFLYGSGVGEPLGALSDNNPSLVSVTRESAGKISADDIATMKSRAYLRNWGNYVWIASQSIIPELLTLTVGDTPVYQTNFKGSGEDAILGRPVFYTDSAPDLGTAGDLALVDWSQYVIADKGDVQQATSMHVRFIYGETTMRFVKRNDGQPTWRAPLTPKSNSALTRSPFVRLGSA